MAKGQTFRPFHHLKQLLREHDVEVEALPAVRIPSRERQPGTPQHEEGLFRKAMEGVRPLSRPKTTAPRPIRRPAARAGLTEDEIALRDLQRLVDSGHGFRVADTPEYIEGKCACVPDDLTRRLHAGAFSVQAHVDLHGLGVTQAQAVVDNLLRQAVREGLRTVLIIHGRGLSSPGKPVLKSHLRQWLRRGAWRKWVLAYTSARVCDGGAGATYVLLRHQAESNRRRKNGAS